jgi:hypothetical protein
MNILISLLLLVCLSFENDTYTYGGTGAITISDNGGNEAYDSTSAK